MTATGAFRLAMYVIGLLASLAVASRLLVVRGRLARALALMMAAWAVNACSLLALLVNLWATGSSFPPWQPAVLTVNAVMCGFAPIVVYVYMDKNGGKSHE